MRPVATLLLFALSATVQAGIDIETWETDNGARVYFVETHQIPMVQFSVGFDAASSRDPVDRHGLASLVSGLMDEGAGDLDADAIAEQFESIGAEYGSQSARDQSVFELRVLSESIKLSKAVELFSLILGDPTFPEADFERHRKQVLVALEQEKQSPDAIVTKAFFEALYGTHPYGHSPIGDEESLARIERKDLVDFHRRYIVASNAVVVIVGAIDRDTAEAVAAQIVAGLPTGDRPGALRPVAPAKAREVWVDFPSSQSHLRLGQIGISRTDPDYFPLYVGNHILGGSGLVSRLSHEIREQRGLSYSVYGYFAPMRRAGPYLVGLQTKNEQAVEARDIALNTIRSFIEDGPTEDELQAAKNNISGGFPLRIDSNQEIADNVMNIAFYGLPLDRLDTFTANVEAVTSEQIRSTFARRLSPGGFVEVRVGADTE